MDTFGAVLGLAIAAIIIYFVQGGELKLSPETYKWLIVVGIVPAVLAIAVLLFFVHERKKASPGAQQKLPRIGLAGFDTRFKLFLVVMAVFTLGNSSDFFVILRAQNLGSSVIYVVLMLVVFNLVYAVTALPAGGAIGQAREKAGYHPGLVYLCPGLPGVCPGIGVVAGLAALCRLRALLWNS
jgi:MFS family permease